MKLTKLAELRSRSFLTQEALAARSGVHRNTISKLENGERKSAHASTVTKLAKALNVEPWELDEYLLERPLSDTEGKKKPGSRMPKRGDFKNKKTKLLASPTKVAEAVRLLQESLDLMDDDQPPEIYYSIELASLILQGWPDEQAEDEAYERVYDLKRDQRGE